jgi:hypothetical protein
MPNASPIGARTSRPAASFRNRAAPGDPASATLGRVLIIREWSVPNHCPPGATVCTAKKRRSLYAVEPPLSGSQTFRLRRDAVLITLPLFPSDRPSRCAGLTPNRLARGAYMQRGFCSYSSCTEVSNPPLDRISPLLMLLGQVPRIQELRRSAGRRQEEQRHAKSRFENASSAKYERSLP